MAKAAKEEVKTEKIVVLIRVRPLQKEESKQKSPWKLSSRSIASSKACRPPVPSHSFTFDRVYGTKASTSEIYEAHIKDIIKSAISGVNGTIIAYGQPGSGKTYTMRGGPEDPGILVLAVQDVFKRLQEDNREFLVRVSYYQVANEELVDLLASKNRTLDVHEDAQIGIVVAGLREEIVVGPEQVLSLLEFADACSSAGPTYTNNGRRKPHSIFRMVIESRLDSQQDLLTAQAPDAVQVSVLNLVEVAPLLSAVVESEGSCQEETKPDKSFISLQTVMSTLSKGTDKKKKLEGLMEGYFKRKREKFVITGIGHRVMTSATTENTLSSTEADCFTLRAHMDGTVETLVFSAKATKVMNCFDVNEIWRESTLLKRQRREIVGPWNKPRVDCSQDLDDIVSLRNAILMIELEKEQMSMENLGKAQLSCLWEKEDHNQEHHEENMTHEGESDFDKCTEMGDVCSVSKRPTLNGCLGDLIRAQELQDLDHQLRSDSGGLGLGPYAGNKRKRRSFTDMVADKLDQVDLLFQLRMARELNCMKSEGICERQQLTELRELIAQLDNQQQENATQKDEECRNLRQKVTQLEEEKAMMATSLLEQETSFHKAIQALKRKLGTKNAGQVIEDLAFVQRCNELEGLLPVEGEKHSKTAIQKKADEEKPFRQKLLWKELEIEESVVTQWAKVQSCLSHENIEQQSPALETDGQRTSQKRKFGRLKANKVVNQKSQTFQGQVEISNLQRELALAMQTMSALKSERDGLQGDLEQLQSRQNDREDKVNKSIAEEERKSDHTNHHLLAAAVDELNAEVESTVSIADALLELVLESFQVLTADLKSFQKGVAELKVLSCATADMSESLEKAKLQLIALRHGKRASEKEVQSMKSELAKLECVIERQSGVLKVLSDNESLLSELSSVRAAMKEAAGASEVRLLNMQQEYESNLKKLECDCENWKRQNLEYEENYTNIQLKLHTAEAEGQTLRQTLEENSDLDKKHKDMLLELKSNCIPPTTEAEILQPTNSLGEQAALNEDNENLPAELAKSRAEVKKLEREMEEQERAHGEILIELTNREDIVLSITAEREDKMRVEEEQQHKITCTENEVVKVTKLLENALLVVETQKRELEILWPRVESMTKEEEEMKTLENSYSTTLDRLVNSETEVARLMEIITSQLEDKSILEQDHTNILYKLESSETEVQRLTASLNRALQEKENLEKELNKTFVEFSRPDSQKITSTGNITREKSHQKSLAAELQEKKRLEEIHQQMLQNFTKEHEKTTLETRNQETLQQVITKRQEEMEQLEKSHQNTIDKLATLELKVAQLNESLTMELEEKITLTKYNQDLSARQQEEKHEYEKETEGLCQQVAKEHKEREALKKTHQNILHKLAAAESQLVQMTGTLTVELHERKRLEQDQQEMLAKRTGDQEQSKVLEKEHQETLRELTKEQETRKELEKTSKNILDKLASSESEVALLTQRLAIELQKNERLEQDSKEAVDRLVSEQAQKSALEAKYETTHQNLTKEHEERELLERAYQTVLHELAESKSELEQFTGTPTREPQEKKATDKDCQELHGTITRALEERDLPEKNKHGILLKLAKEQEGMELSQRTHQTIVGKLPAVDFETLSREQQEKSRLEKRQQEIIDELAREQETRKTLEKNNREILCKLTELDERNTLKRTLQNILDKLSGSEARVVQSTERLNTEFQNKTKIEINPQEIPENLSSEEEHKLIDVTCKTALNERTSKQGEIELTEKNHGNFDHKLDGLKGRVVPLTESLGIDDQKKNKFSLEHDEILDHSEPFKIKIARLTESLSRELERRANLEKQHTTVLAQLASSNADVERLSEKLRLEAAEKKTLMTDHCQVLTKVASSTTEVENLTKMLEGMPRLKEELQNLQLKLAGSEAKCLMQAEQLRKKARQDEEHTLIQLQLAATKAEAMTLSNEKVQLQKDKSELVSTAEAEMIRFKEELGDKFRLEEEYKGVQFMVNDLKAQVSSLTDALGNTTRLEEEQRKVQLDLQTKQGEIAKLTKELRVNCRVIEDQKQLIHKLNNTQIQVLKLTKALGGQSDSTRVQVEQDSTDSTMVGLPCEHCGKRALGVEQKQLQQKLLSAEDELARLKDVVEEKALLQIEYTRVRLEISTAETEIERLTTVIKDKTKLDEQLRKLQLTLSEAGMLRSKAGTNEFQLSLVDLPTELLNIESELVERERELQCKAADLIEKERRLRDTQIGFDVDREALNTIIALREKERDELNEQMIFAMSTLESLRVECEKHRELETAEKKWKSKFHKADRDATDLRVKLEKLEVVAGWLVRDKALLEERLTCCETQLTSLRDAAQTTNNDLEMSRRQIHILTAQHQTEVASLCDEIAVKKAQKGELEAELNRLLGLSRQPLLPPPDINGLISNSPFTPQQWPYLQGSGRHRDPHWGDGQR